MRISLVTLFLLLALPALALDDGRVYLRAGEIDAASTLRQAPADGLLLVKMNSTPGRLEREALEAAGAEILGYLPVNAYLVRAPEAAGLEALAEVAWTSPWLAQWRVDPGLAARAWEAGVLDLCLDLVPGTDASRFSRTAVALGAEPVRAFEHDGISRVYLRASGTVIPRLAELSGLVWLGEVEVAEDRLNESSWVVQTAEEDNWAIWDRGLRGEGQILGHIDSGMQVENCFFADTTGTSVGPDHRKVIYLGPGLPFDSSHGCHTAGILAGDIEPVYGWTITRGIAYHARLASSRYNATGFDLYDRLVTHHEQGARLHSNSWGTDGTTEYTQRCRDIDLFSHDYESDMVAFAVTNCVSNVYTPENAKNVLAVAATKNAPNDFDEHSYGGSAPTADGRRKPEILAPGHYILSAMYANSSDPGNTSGYCRTRYSSGTSMACPTVVGSAALFRQYFTEGWYPSGVPNRDEGFEPSGALLRAALINSALDMNGSGLEGYPAPLEGWGRLQIDQGMYFLGQNRSLYLEDLPHAEGLDTGESHEYQFEILPGDDPLQVTLAFSDAPGLVNALFPVVNDLDLELVSPTGVTYLGNLFAEGESQTGGQSDEINSVERVLRYDPEEGVWTLRVTGAAVPDGPQGYGVIVSGNLPVDDLTPPEVSLAASEQDGALQVLGSANETLQSAQCTVLWQHSGESVGPLTMACHGNECSVLVDLNMGDTGSALVTVSAVDLGSNETVETLEGDWIAPLLHLSFLAPDPDTLLMGIWASEELAEASVDLGEETLPADLVDPLHFYYEARLPVSVPVDSLALCACGEDLVGLSACEDHVLSMYPAAAGEALNLVSPDGFLRLELPAGSLPEAALLIVGESENPRSLAGYDVRPHLGLDAPALLFFDYGSVTLPGESTPLALTLSLGGVPLESFVDEDAARLLAGVESLGYFEIGAGPEGSSTFVDADFLGLEPAWPNPFVPQLHGMMTMRLSLRDSQSIRVEIFDVTGRRVRVLHEKAVYPGTLDLSWNGHDSEGRDLASGVYFVRLSTSRGSITGKVMLIQ